MEPETGMTEELVRSQTFDKQDHRKNLFKIHFSVMLFGMSALFSKMVYQPAPILTWGRVTVSSLFLFFFHRTRKIDIRITKKRDLWALFAVGIVLAVHWSTFFFSSQTSTVAVATLTFSTFPVFVTFMEPCFLKEKLRIGDVICALIMLFGVLCIVPEFHMGNKVTLGILWGMISSFCYAVMSLANRSFAGRYPGTVIAFYEQGAAAIIMLPLLLFYKPVFSPSDLFLIFLLGTVFTGVAHSFFISGMKTVKAQTAGIISGLESIYGILFAALLLGELPGCREVAGGIIILLVVFYSTKKAES